jgi:signal transduction histidine kinase
MTRRGAPPLDLLSSEAVGLITQSLTDYICAHLPVYDADGNVIDGTLVWWNPAYERVRVEPVRYGQSIMATYYQPEIAMDYLRRALAEGSCTQIFELSGDEIDIYRVAGDLVRMYVDWLQVGSVVVEVGVDESRVSMLEVQLHEQELAVREVLQQRMRDLDRERIARDLHDSVIQQLFVTVLDLQSALTGDTDTTQAAITRAIVSIDDAMTELRKTIYDIGHDTRESLEQRLREVVASFSGAPFSVELQVDLGVELPDELAEDVSMVVLEGLANVARHAHAARCDVQVTIDGHSLVVRVTDDGVGPPTEFGRTSGLANMTERARLHGGWCWLRPVGRRRGSQLTWSVPLPV